MTIVLPEKVVYQLGLQLAANWPTEALDTVIRKRNKNRINDFYYASATTLVQIFHDIQDPDLGPFQVKAPNIIDFLGAFYFLKKYPTKITMAGFLDCHESRANDKVWKYLFAIQALKEKKIEWIFDQNNQEFDEFYLATVDGVHFRITEPRFMPSSGWYSPKYNKAGLTYLVAVALFHDKIVHVDGPFPAGQNDLRIFRKDLINKVPEGRRLIADEGFVGEPEKCSTKNSFDSADVKEFKNRAKARQETINTRLKSFGVLNQVFRTTGKLRLERHKTVFEACLTIIQYEMDNGSSRLMKV